MEVLSEFVTKFKVSDLEVHSIGSWTWSVRPEQPTLASTILSVNREALSFSDLTPEEGRDLALIVKVVEATLSKAFSYDKVNYLMLMMVDKQVHFHVIPRYGAERTFAGRTWTDDGWPKPPVLASQESSPDVITNIKDELVRNLSGN